MRCCVNDGRKRMNLYETGYVSESLMHFRTYKTKIFIIKEKEGPKKQHPLLLINNLSGSYGNYTSRNNCRIK